MQITDSVLARFEVTAALNSSSVEELARRVDRDVTTVRRWASGRTTPSRESRARVRRLRVDRSRTDYDSVRNLRAMVTAAGGPGELAAAVSTEATPVPEELVWRWLAGTPLTFAELGAVRDWALFFAPQTMGEVA